MASTKQRATLNVEITTKERLIKRLKYGETPNKAILDLLDMADRVEAQHNTLPVQQEVTR